MAIRNLLFALEIGFLFLIWIKSVHTQLKPVPIKNVPNFREINWCITGRDEPELHEFPFSQFTALLRRDQLWIQNPKYRYRIEFNEIYSRMPINAEVTCNTSITDPWCIPINCGADLRHCKEPPYRVEFIKYIGRLYKTVHVIVRSEERRDPTIGVTEVWIPSPLEGLVLQANRNPRGFGVPTGQFFIEEDIICHDCNRSTWGRSIPCRKRSVLEAVHPTVLVYHYQMSQIDINQNLKLADKQSEVHANFRWYSTPCLETRRLEFKLLAVHNFKENIYDVLTLGPFEIFGRGQIFHPESMPTPIFRGYFYHRNMQGSWCHAAASRDIQVIHPPLFKKFEMSPNFDACIRDETNPRRLEIGDTVTEVNLRMCNLPAQPVCPFSVWSVANELEHANHMEESEPRCSEVCPLVNEQTTVPSTTRAPPIIKRNYHGGVLIMTNFCLMPINTFIARFYKETLNIENYKGVKVWFWWHLLGSMISSVMIYFGTFQAGVIDPSDGEAKAHAYLGKTYTFILALCYFTAWGRHQNKWINLATEFVHGCLGYLTILLAHISMHYAPGVGFVPKLLVDLQIFLHCLFMFIMTGHICVLDAKFGMRPGRRHFPTVEARFDDIPIPKKAFRMVLLGILATFTFGCSIITLFIQ